MPTHPVRSGRTAVVGDSPVARGIRARLQARRVAAADTDVDRFVGDDVVVLVGHTGDVGQVGARRAALWRDELVTAVEGVLVDAAAAGVARVVAISSAMVNGAAPDRAVIDDDEPRVVPTDDGAVAGLVAFEEAVQDAAAEHGVALTVLRPAVLVGPEVDTLMTRHFEAPRVLTVRGVRRGWQLVHVDDLADAVQVVADHGLDGCLTVGALVDGAPDVLAPDAVLRAAGMRAVDLPAATAFATAERLHRLGVLPAPASDLGYAVYPWSVSARELHAAGWAPVRSSRDCLEVLLGQVQGRVGVAGRRVGGRDAAALGAAGAAVALLGTAAILKQARGRR